MRPSALEYVESKQMRKDLTDFRTGDTVRVHWKVREGEKERVQPFEGVVIRKTKGANRATFTVRKMSYGVGVERIFPLHSPRYERIEVRPAATSGTTGCSTSAISVARRAAWRPRRSSSRAPLRRTPRLPRPPLQTLRLPPPLLQRARRASRGSLPQPRRRADQGLS